MQPGRGVLNAIPAFAGMTGGGQAATLTGLGVYPKEPAAESRPQTRSSRSPRMSQDTARYASMANAIRALSMDAVEAANSGHPGMPMGMADVATVLWSEFLKFDPADPKWPDRDRFVLSADRKSVV